MKKFIILVLVILLALGNGFGAVGAETVSYEVQAAAADGTEVVEREVREEVYSPEFFEENYEDRRASYTIQSYQSNELPKVTVNNPVLYVGQENQVIITVTQNNLPLPDKTLFIRDLPYGPTDANGQVTVTLNPSSRGSFGVIVDNIGFATLYAIYGDEGVIEISAKDRSGSQMGSFSVFAASTNMTSTTTISGGGAATLIVKKGSSNLVLTKNGQNGEPGYYLFKTVNVTAGQVHQLIFDGSQTVAADLDFSYDSSPIQNAEVYFDRSDQAWSPSLFRETVGLVSSTGKHIVYITAGPYDIFFKGNSQTGELLFLGTNKVYILDDSFKYETPRRSEA